MGKLGKAFYKKYSSFVLKNEFLKKARPTSEALLPQSYRILVQARRSVKVKGQTALEEPDLGLIVFEGPSLAPNDQKIQNAVPLSVWRKQPFIVVPHQTLVIGPNPGDPTNEKTDR